MPAQSTPNPRKRGTDKPCAVCGTIFYAVAARPRARFCSVRCKGIGSRLPVKRCAVCGKEWQPTFGKGLRPCCSRACGYAYRRNGNARPCVVCGKMKYRPAGYKISPHGVFCGNACWNAYQTYSPERLIYGAHWHRQRKAALRRDGHACRGCGIGSRSIRGGLHVHHIIPFKRWPDQDSAHQLANLIALCPSCHKRADLAFHRDGSVLFGVAPDRPNTRCDASRS